MMQFDKRLSQIEAKMKPKEEKPAAHVAMIQEEGKVTVMRPRGEGSFQLQSEKALQTWMEDNQVNEDQFIKVIIVNSNNAGGEPPREL